MTNPLLGTWASTKHSTGCASDFIGLDMRNLPKHLSGPVQSANNVRRLLLMLPKSEQGNKYCLVVSDYYTRWPEVFPLPDQRATTVAKALIDGIVSHHGIPTTLHSDQGGSFDNEVLREVCRMVGIRKVRTSPYHPQSDGLVERLNRTLLQLLSKFVADKPATWDQWLELLLFAYRTSVQASTGFSPFYLVYGREPTLPADFEFSLPKSARYRSAREYLEDVRRNQRLARELVEENMASAQGRQARNSSPVVRYQIVPGDKVLLHEPAMQHGSGYKLARPWTGPFTVTECLGKVNYRIKDSQRKGPSKVVHFNRLKPYLQRGASSTGASTSDAVAMDDSAAAFASNVSSTSAAPDPTAASASASSATFRPAAASASATSA